MVSAPSSSASSMRIVLRASEGVRGTAFECRIGNGEELRAMLNSSQKGRMTIEGENVLFESEVRRGRESENWFVFGRERLFELAIMPQSGGMKSRKREQEGPLTREIGSILCFPRVGWTLCSQCCSLLTMETPAVSTSVRGLGFVGG